MRSEVFALDTLSVVHGHPMNATDGARDRRDILAPGGELPPDLIVEHFLGRRSNSDAFSREITGRR